MLFPEFFFPFWFFSVSSKLEVLHVCSLNSLNTTWFHKSNQCFLLVGSGFKFLQNIFPLSSFLILIVILPFYCNICFLLFLCEKIWFRFSPESFAFSLLGITFTAWKWICIWMNRFFPLSRHLLKPCVMWVFPSTMFFICFLCCRFFSLPLVHSAERGILLWLPKWRHDPMPRTCHRCPPLLGPLCTPQFWLRPVYRWRFVRQEDIISLLFFFASASERFSLKK